jgi:signal transduction histidine kinase
VWANAVGAAVFGVTGAAEYGRLRFAPNNPLPGQIARLAATLPPAGQERLERLRGIGAGLGRPVVCACSRMTLPDGTAAVLIAACEPAGPTLPLGERVRRLFAGVTGAIAVFAGNDKLLHATDAALRRLGGATTLSALGLTELAAEALQSGRANGNARVGDAAAQFAALRLGRDDSRALVLTLPPGDAVIAQHPADADQSAPAVTPPPTNSAAPAVTVPAAMADEVSQPPTTPSPSKSNTPPVSAAAETLPSEQQALDELPAAERLHPLRFVWHMDADSRFAIGSDEFAEIVGPRAISACGRLWSEIATELKLDPENRVAHAVATRETWSGIPVEWPVDDTDERLPVELSGLPVFDRDRVFRGYRGFGVCRDIDRINQLARHRQTRPLGFTPEALSTSQGKPEGAEDTFATTATPISAAETGERRETDGDTPRHPESPRLGIVPAAANVVPFRSAPLPEPKAPSLSPVERNAFRELAQELTARLRTPGAEPAAAEQVAIAPDEAANPVNLIAAEPLRPALPPDAAHALLDRVPAGILVYRNDALLFANRHFLELSGYDSLQTLATAGGLQALFAEPGPAALSDSGDTQTLSITTRHGEQHPVEGRLFSVPWNGDTALALILVGAQAPERLRAAQSALEESLSENRDIRAALDRTARREADKTAAAKADFLAKVNHEIRTPLNSMIGFAEVILAERFGSIGNERYREYLRDMHGAGMHLVSLLNDLVDLSKIETGQTELNVVELDLNELTQQCVGIMQPQANRSRIIIRNALTPGLSRVMADERSVRQIVLSLLGHAIRHTGPGGQVIVSTASGDGGEAMLRVRDTGPGMAETEIAAAVEPLRHDTAAAGWGANGSSFGLALTKALAEANGADFSIKSAPNTGSLIEIGFPSGHAAAR